MRFYVTTLGCKVNQYESQAIANILLSRGHERAASVESCDVCVVNTCAVTAESERKSRRTINRMKKAEPGALIAVCGCLSQLDPDIAAFLGADLVGGSVGRYGFALEAERLYNEKALTETRRSDISRRGELRDERALTQGLQGEGQCEFMTGDPAEQRVFEDLPAVVEPPSAAAGNRTRALLKIQDGCDNYCAYCVIPYARGRARSLPVDRAVSHARELEEAGYREIVITGIEISSYGKDLAGKPSLAGVARAIGAAAPSARLRLGSLDPRIISPEFCDEISSVPNLCGHFHLSLQSGCDETLARMGRKYGTDAASESIAAIRRRFPVCGITADLITGFPGETDAEFERTLSFIKSAAFSQMHIFPFSPRPGTRASAMGDQVDRSVRRNRARAAAAVAAEMALEYRLGMTGETVDVLFERTRGGHWVGFAGNYVEVTAASGGARNTISPVLITKVSNGVVLGEITKGG